MYTIKPESVKTFVLDRNIKLPRFQRKQTWTEKKNFQLCISLFKQYPLGVTILSVEEKNGKTIRWLLDGRQRRNALLQVYENPENIYIWARKFIGFKNNDQPDEIGDRFWEKIQEYIEYDDIDNADIEDNNDVNDDESSGAFVTDENIDLDGNTGLDFLLEIIKIFHNKSLTNNGFTKPFDICKYVRTLPYADNNRGANMLSSKKLKNFLDEYRKYCDLENLNYEQMQSFYQFISSRCDITEPDKLKQFLEMKKSDMVSRINLIERIDNLLANSTIGLIEVKNLSPVDSQKIFNIINTEGEKLTAVEVLSAKPSWNTIISNVSDEMKNAVNELYERIGTNYVDVVKWDLPATLLRRIGNNFIVKKFSDSATDFAKEITFGFKLIAGIWNSGVKKEDYESLSINRNINWANEYEELVYDLKSMIKLMESFNYFEFFKTWRTSIMELTSESIALNFFIIMFLDWKRKGKPIGNNLKARMFGKNCLILWDKLIYEYVSTLWRGSADAKIAANIGSIKNEPDGLFTKTESNKWLQIFDEIESSAKIMGNKISEAMMKPILYHFYCLKSISAPTDPYSIEIDHIIPQTLFENSTINDKEHIKDSIFNLGLLPKKENISKTNKRLIEITDDWLKDQIANYEFVTPDQYQFYSDITNYQTIFAQRKRLFAEVFGGLRDQKINN